MLKSVILVQEERIAQLELENGWELEETTRNAKNVLGILDEETSYH